MGGNNQFPYEAAASAVSFQTGDFECLELAAWAPGYENASFNAYMEALGAPLIQKEKAFHFHETAKNPDFWLDVSRLNISGARKILRGTFWTCLCLYNF